MQTLTQAWRYARLTLLALQSAGSGGEGTGEDSMNYDHIL